MDGGFTQLDTSSPALDRLKHYISVLERFKLDIEKALSYGGNTHTFDYVCARVMSGSLIMYDLPNSVMLCEKIEYEKFNVFNVYIAGGNLQEILDFESAQLGKEAYKSNCRYLTFAGRQGWVAALKDRGWSQLNVNMMREIDNGQNS